MNYWDNPLTYRKTVWVALLSNGETIYEEGTWADLCKRCRAESLNIEDFGLKFMDNEVWLGKADGYYFTNGAIGFLHGPTFNLKNIGLIQNGKLKVRSYRCPELLLVEEEERELNEQTLSCTNLI